MSLAVILAFQTAMLPVPAEFDLARLTPIDFDLRYLRGTQCAAGAAGDIVICGRRPRGGSYPLEEMARIFAIRPLRAEAGIGGNVTARAFAEQVGMDRGAVSNRAMIGIKLPF